MSNLFNLIPSAFLLLLLALASNAGLLFADQDMVVEPAQKQEQTDSGVTVTQLALNDADVSAKKEREKSVAETAPVLLVPMVLAVLALVAVSRRKER